VLASNRPGFPAGAEARRVLSWFALNYSRADCCRTSILVSGSPPQIPVLGWFGHCQRSFKDFSGLDLPRTAVLATDSPDDAHSICRLAEETSGVVYALGRGNQEAQPGPACPALLNRHVNCVRAQPPGGDHNWHIPRYHQRCGDQYVYLVKSRPHPLGARGLDRCRCRADGRLNSSRRRLVP